MSDQNPQNAAQSFLRTAKQGDQWIHSEYGKLAVQGVIRDNATGNPVEMVLLPLNPEAWRVKNLQALAQGIERKYISTPRPPKRVVDFDPAKRAA